MSSLSDKNPQSAESDSPFAARPSTEEEYPVLTPREVRELAFTESLLSRGLFFAGKKPDEPKTPWQFTLRDLFVHFTALAVLMSLWSWFFTSIHNAREQRESFSPQQTITAEDSPATPSD